MSKCILESLSHVTSRRNISQWKSEKTRAETKTTKNISGAIKLLGRTLSKSPEISNILNR